MAGTTIVGFDSAWVDKPTAPGAVCAIRLGPGGQPAFAGPELASFAQALAFIKRERTSCDKCLVALDQPTIVPNSSGCRPVDRVAGSLISWLGGGVQPANRSKVGMFDDAAPIWRFKEALGAVENPEAARVSQSGLFLTEVFPALALPTLEAAYLGRLLGPRYNPDRRRTFTLESWQVVGRAIRHFAEANALNTVAGWAEQSAAILRPRKPDQDRLDSVLCALIGYVWLVKPRHDSIMIGDLQSGYMITPASSDIRGRLTMAAMMRGVPVDGRVTS